MNEVQKTVWQRFTEGQIYARARGGTPRYCRVSPMFHDELKAGILARNTPGPVKDYRSGRYDPLDWSKLVVDGIAVVRDESMCGSQFLFTEGAQP